MKPSRRVSDLERALKGTVALCPACHKALSGQNLFKCFSIKEVKAEGFTVQARKRGRCKCKDCSK